MITAGGTVIRQTGMSSMLAPTDIPSIAAKRTDPKMAPHLSMSTEDGSMADSSPQTLTWNAIPPKEHDEEDRAGRNCSSKEREGHECGECWGGDRECARDEIGQIGGYENRRT